MNSFDTNVLLYAVNVDSVDHGACKRMVDQALSEPESWIIADQVWFELYRLIRNQHVLPRPLTAEQAADLVAWYRNRSGWKQCAWNPRFMQKLLSEWQDGDFPARRSFDAVLAVTLKAHGVSTLYTRNIRDFNTFGFFHVIDPAAQS